MNTTVINATEYRDVPLAALFESTTNPHRHFDEAFLKGLAASTRANGVLSPLLVRPKNDSLEIVFGAQRYRAAQIAEAATVPVSIREMTDAQVLEAQLIEPPAPRCSSDGRGTGLARLARTGRTQVQHRADCG